MTLPGYLRRRNGKHTGNKVLIERNIGLLVSPLTIAGHWSRGDAGPVSNIFQFSTYSGCASGTFLSAPASSQRYGHLLMPLILHTNRGGRGGLAGWRTIPDNTVFIAHHIGTMGVMEGPSIGPLERRTAYHIAPPERQQSTGVPAPTLLNGKPDKILEAITATSQDLHNRVDAMTVGISLLQEDQKKLSTTVACTENELKKLRPSLTDLEGQVKSLAANVQELEHRAEDSEGCSRWNNLRIVGFPEEAEGTDPVYSFETWFAQTVEADHLSPHYIV
ncbi:hypothetical protein NDU88_001070 [Pleurodeles waltl]|uniref:Uncharacterized protein n=1 Tax=Pleurodeles waltl TaxID=8319 RepID=A0AAV7VVW2_PLEWA|nr:hypothetical protein NDU88_001070 [Pleurodeles waltl]